MSIKALLYEQYSDLFETSPVPLTEIECALSAFNLQAAMLHLSQINILLAQGILENSFYKLQETLCLNFFDGSIIKRINDKYAGKRQDPPTFFFRLLVLFLVRVCARVCSDSEEARKIDSIEDRHAFGWCCLWITDHLATEAELKAISEGSDESRRRAMGPQIAALLEFGSPPRLERAITRADILFTEIIRERKTIKEMGGFDFLRVFKEETGLAVERFCNIVFFIVGWFYAHKIDQMFEDTSKFVIHRSTYLSLTEIDQETFDKFLELTSVPVQQLPPYLNDYKGAANRDFSAIQSKPLAVLKNGAIACLDVDFLVEKLSTGMYWIIDEKYSEKHKHRAKSAWGYLFQRYVNRIFNDLYPPTKTGSLIGTFTESPKYTTTEEAFDGILTSPTNPKHLFVFQYKSQFIKPEKKYSEDVELFELTLDSAGFGVWQKGGVKQLVNNIEFLWNKDKSQRKQLKAPLCRLEGYERVMPILVVQESFFRGDFINWTLNNRFQALLLSAQVWAGVTIEPLLVIDIESLEILKPYILSGACAFSQPVNSLTTFDRDRRASFRRHLSDYLQQFNRVKDEETGARFAKIMERIQLLFKDPELKETTEGRVLNDVN